MNEEERAEGGWERDLYLQLLELGTRDAPQPFVEEALALVIKLSGARRGIVQLYSRGPHGTGQQAAVAANMGDSDDLAFSQTVILETLATGQALLTCALRDERFKDSGSVRAHKLDAVLCVPIGRDPILGVVYLQDKNGGPTFTQRDQHWVELFARHVATAADRLILRNLEATERDATLEIRKRLKADGLIGRSEAFADVLGRAWVAAQSDAAVLLTGASGSGKTALARTIHANSARASAPFVEVNCGALRPDLGELEVLDESKLRAAHGGTLFLGEIGDLPLLAQIRFAQMTWESGYASGPETQQVDVRVIATTNQDLNQAVAEQRFHPDLYYRLSMLAIRMPSLAERRRDLSLLANQLCERACSRHKLPYTELSAGALAAIENEEWPGNIRELDRCIASAAVVACAERSTRIERRHLFPIDPEPPAHRQAKRYAVAMREFQRKLVMSALGESNWTVKTAAQTLDITRAHLYNLMHTLDIKRPRD